MATTGSKYLSHFIPKPFTPNFLCNFTFLSLPFPHPNVTFTFSILLRLPLHPLVSFLIYHSSVSVNSHKNHGFKKTNKAKYSFPSFFPHALYVFSWLLLLTYFLSCSSAPWPFVVEKGERKGKNWQKLLTCFSTLLLLTICILPPAVHRHQSRLSTYFLLLCCCYKMLCN